MQSSFKLVHDEEPFISEKSVQYSLIKIIQERIPRFSNLVLNKTNDSIIKKWIDFYSKKYSDFNYTKKGYDVETDLKISYPPFLSWILLEDSMGPYIEQKVINPVSYLFDLEKKNEFGVLVYGKFQQFLLYADVLEFTPATERLARAIRGNKAEVTKQEQFEFKEKIMKSHIPYASYSNMLKSYYDTLRVLDSKPKMDKKYLHVIEKYSEELHTGLFLTFYHACGKVSSNSIIIKLGNELKDDINKGIITEEVEKWMRSFGSAFTELKKGNEI